MNTQTKFILFIVGIIILIGSIGFIVNHGPGKYDEFAQKLTDGGAKFYGAFWCPHCQAQKKEFGSSKKYLPYVECSNTDNSPKQVCLDNKVEGYPTWSFDNGIRITSEKDPIICPVVKEGEKGVGACENSSSNFYPVYLFDGFKFSIKSGINPVKAGNIWQFAGGAQAVGEIPLQFLADQIGYTLPQ